MTETGGTVTHGRITYEVVRRGCATFWENCPHGEHALTVVRVGRTLTECIDERTCTA